MNKKTQTENQFEKFVKKINELIAELKENHLTDDEGNTYKIEDFDFRAYNDVDSIIFSLPTTEADFKEMWDFVQEKYNEYIADPENDNIPDEMYFDVFWNNTKANCAFYEEGVTLWIYFDYEFGIYYDDDTKIIQKINNRD